jgi:hypothetical protein
VLEERVEGLGCKVECRKVHASRHGNAPIYLGFSFMFKERVGEAEQSGKTGTSAVSGDMHASRQGEHTRQQWS